MISGQIVCFIAMHSLPYFYRQPLYRPGSRKASVSFVIFLAADLALLHVFYKNTAYKENASQSFASLGEIKWKSILSGGAKIMRAVKAHLLNREGPVFPI